MKLFYGIIFLVLFNSLQGFQDTIMVEANEVKTLNLSEIATSSESIVLEIPSEMADRFLTDLAVNQDYIFVMTINKGNGPGNSIALQFQRNGKFIQQIGEMTNGWNSLFFDQKK